MWLSQYDDCYRSNEICELFDGQRGSNLKYLSSNEFNNLQKFIDVANDGIFFLQRLLSEWIEEIRN
jgi:hypothetical protein